MVVCVSVGASVYCPCGAECAIGAPMGLRYGNRASTGAAGALCCDNRGFAGGDIHSIINNPPPTAAHAAHKNTSTHMRESTYKLRNTHIHKEHVFLIPSFPCYIIFTQHHNQDYIHTHTHSHTRAHTDYYEAAQPSAAHAWLLSRGHADCMSYSSISMLRAWSCVYTTLLFLPPATSPLCLPLSSFCLTSITLFHAY